LPALWTAAKKQHCTLEEIMKWLCEKPAALTDLHLSKGRIAPGYDADLVAWDPDTSFTITADQVRHRHKVTPYLGETLYGKVAQSWLAGERVFAKGKILHLNKGRILYHG
jgi:allantoinase